MAPHFSDWSDVPDNLTVPDGPYTVAVEKLEATNSKAGKLMYRGSYRIVEPAAYLNLPLYETFVVGTEDDPGADDPETWKSPKAVAVRLLKQQFNGAKLDMRQSIDQLVEQIVGSQVKAVVRIEVEPTLQRDGTPNQYAGRQRNRIDRFLPLDGVVAAVGAARPTAVPRPVAPPAVARPAARPMGIQPPAAVAPAPAPAPAAAAKRRELMIPCSFCATEVPRSQWAAHEATHETAADTPA